MKGVGKFPTAEQEKTCRLNFSEGNFFAECGNRAARFLRSGSQNLPNRCTEGSGCFVSAGIGLDKTGIG